MNTLKNILLYTLVFFAPLLSFSQKVATWKYAMSNPSPKVGDNVELIFDVAVADDWYIYSSDFDPNCGPTVTTFLVESKDVTSGGVKAIKPKKKFDDVFGCNVTYFTRTGQFRIPLTLLSEQGMVKVTVEYQVCTDGKCIPLSEVFEILFTAAPNKSFKKPVEEHTKETSETNPAQISTEDSSTIVPTTTEKMKFSSELVRKSGFSDIEVIRYKGIGEQNTNKESLIFFFVAAIVSGLLALLTPCVFPMIPMTVTFFTNTSQSRREGVFKAFMYGFFIVLIYVIIGLIVSRFSGPGLATELATNWVPNMIFFVVFIIFALSFLGLFEITLPSSFITKVDAKSEKGGLGGLFFMAFTLVLVSFSCTGPIMGSILVLSAEGDVIKPVVGMLGFSLAFAIPFTLFAIFPAWLSGLPKSGGWLNVVKVVLGFLELALAFKFLSQADQAYHWRILDREVFLAIWIAVFLVMTLYLLGKIRMPHDSPIEKLSVPRVISAIMVLSFVIYLIPGMVGAPLKALSGVLPPATTQDFDLYRSTKAQGILCESPMYADQLTLPHNLQGYFDLRQAIHCAAQQDKPIFIDYTGHGCANCREMEARVWSDPNVLNVLSSNFVMLAMYGDDKKIQIPAQDRYMNQDGVQISSLGKYNADFLLRKFNQQAQPFYILLRVDQDAYKQGKIVLHELTSPSAYDLSISNFSRFLEKGLENYK